MDKNSIIEKLQQLAILEAQATSRLENLKIAEEALHKTPEYYVYSADVTELATIQNAAVALRNEIKSIIHVEATEENFADRKPVAGVEIKQFESITITDEKAAKAWASANMPNALSLKTSELSKVLKGGLEVDWAKVEPEYRVQLASDLSQYLPKEDEHSS